MNIFRRFKAAKIDSENPYARAMLVEDTSTKNMWSIIYQLWGAMAGVTLGLIISLAIIFYMETQAKEFHHFIMVDRDYQPVEAISRRADIMADSDPIKEGFTANFLKAYVMWWRERMMDDSYLTTKLNQARLQVAGIATVKFKADLDAHDPWKQNKKEQVVVTIPAGTPVRVSKDGATKTWLVNWTETAKDITGAVVRVENKGGHFLIAEDPKRVSTDNPFGLVVVDQEYK